MAEHSGEPSRQKEESFYDRQMLFQDNKHSKIKTAKVQTQEKFDHKPQTNKRKNEKLLNGNYAGVVGRSKLRQATECLADTKNRINKEVYDIVKKYVNNSDQ